MTRRKSGPQMKNPAMAGFFFDACAHETFRPLTGLGLLQGWKITTL